LPLRWFRFGKQENEQEATAEEAVATESQEPPEDEVVVDADGAPSETPKKKRRRGSRGGRGRKKKTPTADAAEETPAEEAVAETTKPERAPKRTPERKPDRRAARGGRRRAQTKRAPLPAAKRDLLITVDVGEQRVAILEDDRVAEVYLERPERRSIAGNIYLGVVDNVLPGMEAAFVEIGLEKNGFLYVDEIVGPELEGRKGARKIQDLIKRGQTIMVQAVKDPMKTKGARLTTEISLPGRYLVYVPNGEGNGVSRRLDDAERTRLKDILRNLDPKGGGIIVRTAAEGASAEDIERDLVFLQRLWKNIQARAKVADVPALVYEEAELPLRIVRDLFAGDFASAQIDDDRAYRRIVNYLRKTSPHMAERVHRYRDPAPLFEAFGVDEAIRSTLDRRVDLPSGGYLVFDYAEAFTVIDVNTGRFVGQRGKSAQGRLEDTIVKNNLEAVTEVVRQLRLRDIGGIIVIDFIDMANPKNRETVEEALRSELERDRTKTYVVEISPLGLVEMTRQNVTDGPREILTNRCAVCSGDGFVVSDATFALEVERKLRAIAKGARAQAFRVAVHPRILWLLAGAGGERLAAVEAASRRRFFLEPAAGNGHHHLDHVEVLAHGKLDAIRPTTPVEDGASVDLKLVEVGLYDATAGVGKIGDYEVVVAGAAKLVGKKVTATVGRALDGVAFAAIPVEGAPPSPITFEAEAEKPVRASRSKKEEAPGGAEEGVEAAELAVAAEAAELEVAAEALEAEPVEEPGAAEEATLETAPGSEESPVEGAPKKKRTRRGSRGGRGRKKAAGPAETGDEAASAGETVGAEEAATPEGAAGGDGRPAPRIHVPAPELGKAEAPAKTRARKRPAGAVDAEPTASADVAAPEAEEGEPVEPATDGQPKRKRSRRGSRGGRGRKKAPAAAGDADAPAGAAEEAGTPNGQADAPEYVPMAEWIGDFESRSRS
jgi:ribonuclease G